MLENSDLKKMDIMGFALCSLLDLNPQTLFNDPQQINSSSQMFTLNHFFPRRVGK